MDEGRNGKFDTESDCRELYRKYAKHNAQLSQRDRAAEFVSFDQKWKTETRSQYLTDMNDRSIFNHCDIIGLQSYRIPWKKTQNKHYYAIQGHRNRYQLPVCDFLLSD